MPKPPTLNIILPVLNEQDRLEAGIDKAAAFLMQERIPAILTIVDNGSHDRTPEIAKALCAKYASPESIRESSPESRADSRLDFPIDSGGAESSLKVEYLRLERKGVGLALRSAIAHNAARQHKGSQGSDGAKASESCTFCAFIGYMDIDLSTDIAHISEVYATLCAGAPIVVGSRLLRGAKVSGRSLKRELCSRALNAILHAVLRTRFSDAMCGFKFYQASIAERLRAHCSDDDGWFYCAQMLIIAEHLGLPIAEIPVRWSDEASGSKVKILPLARIYLREIWRLRAKFRAKSKATPNPTRDTQHQQAQTHEN